MIADVSADNRPMQDSSARRIVTFIGVGGSAAAVHMACVYALVGFSHWPPLFANVVAFLVAFWVSFFGHFRLTFRSNQAPMWRAIRRFFAVSVLGFATNELAYAALLHWTALPYMVALVVVLVGVAAGTYLLGRYWAFRGASRMPG